MTNVVQHFGKQKDKTPATEQEMRQAERVTELTSEIDRGRDGPKATPPSKPDWQISRIRLSG